MPGLFIVLEGSDGSGKTTQFKLLTERLRAAGHEVDIYDFPRYDEPSSYFVRRYLDGEYGPASEVSPYTASIFYALDRYETAPLIRQSLADGKIVLSDRYVGSNMAHQGTKFNRPAEQRGFFMWEDSLEHQLLGIPRPNLNFFLRVPAETASELLKKRNQKLDAHEQDIEHLRKAVSAYDALCRLFPKDYKVIECSRGGKLLSIAKINNQIWEMLKPTLPRPTHAGRTAVVKLADRAVEPELVSGSAQTSAIKDGDIAGRSLDIKDVSLLAVSNFASRGLDVRYELKWPESTVKARLNYYIPAELSPKLSAKYKRTMDKLAEISRWIDSKLPANEKQYLMQLAPLANLVNVTISGMSNVKNLIASQPSLTDMTELRQISKQARAHLNQPQVIKQIISQVAERRLGSHSAEDDERIRLLSALPRNEFDILADCLYQYSNLSRDEILAQIDQWTYDQKANALKTLAISDSRSLQRKLRYHFYIIEDAAALENLMSALGPHELQMQLPTPRYGYDVPEAIERSGVDEMFIKCFDLSLELYSDIQAAGLDEVAGYAVLRGHRQRWQFSVDGEAIFKPGSDLSIISRLKEQITEFHPIISATAAETVLGKTKIRARLPSAKKTAQ